MLQTLLQGLDDNQKLDSPKAVKARTHNSTFAIGGVLCSADSFVVTESSVLRINICA